MLAAVGLSALGAGVVLLWSAVANVSPLDVIRDTFDPTRDPGTRRPIASPTSTSTGSGPANPRQADGPAVGALSTVHGITVAASIAGNLSALIDAAKRDGIALAGSGYRSNSRQRELYAQNCPGGVCKVPTAVPGTSMHERGLAVDFTHQGRSISSRSSPAFRWLARNAGRYGFVNLPSEPWHWSTNGR